VTLASCISKELFWKEVSSDLDSMRVANLDESVQEIIERRAE